MGVVPGIRIALIKGGLLFLLFTVISAIGSQAASSVKVAAVVGGPLAESGLQADSLADRNQAESFSRRFIHRVGLEFRPGYVFSTNSFLQGLNQADKPVRNAYAVHLKYSFQYHPGTWADRVYGGAYQGVGAAYSNFGNTAELGNPLSLYLFQGARIVGISPRLSFNYEWNFGLSLGWKPYDPQDNRYNVMIGSGMNAYINTNFYFNWILSPQFDLTAGVSLTHYSNGNTGFPNAGLNMASFKAGLVYNINRRRNELLKTLCPYVPAFPRHVCYDLVVFGSWRRKGYRDGDVFVPSPLAYKVIGMNLAALYNVSYKFRAGVALDGVYDASANVFALEVYDGGNRHFVKPPFNAQIALGVSGRAEYVMPYFIVGIGMGTNILHRGGDLKAFYQMLVLKVKVTRNSFLHIGYNLQEFRTPNYLMLGIGYRFNNKYPLVAH